MSEKIEFAVRRDPVSGYCASADVGETSIFTEAESLDQLHSMIEDALALYRAETGEEVLAFSMTFSEQPLAA